MVFDKMRMARLSGLMTESKGIKNAMADQFGGGKEEGDPWIDGEVTTEGSEEEGDMMHLEEDDDDLEVSEAKKRKKRAADDDEDLDETRLRQMIRNEIREAKRCAAEEKKKKKAADDKKAKDKKDEAIARQMIRNEIKSVMGSRGIALGGLGHGFKR